MCVNSWEQTPEENTVALLRNAAPLTLLTEQFHPIRKNMDTDY